MEIIVSKAFECERMKQLYQNALSKMQQVEMEEKRDSVIQQLLEQEVS